MIRKFAPLLLPLAVASILAAPVTAFEIDAMSDAERDIFRAEIRNYLLENPEVLMEAIAVLEERQEMGQAATDEALVTANYAALVGDGHSWIGGNPDGDITVIEFLDYRCGFCKRAFPEVEALMAGDGNIRKIIKEFPILGDQSVLASRFAIATKLAVGDEAYKAMHDALMVHRGNISEPALERIATDLGLDTGAIISAMSLPRVDEIINENRQLAQAMQITGTPTFVIGGQMLRGFLPLEGLQAVVADERG